MSFSGYTRVLLALASGLALALSLPEYNFSLLAWVAVGLLVLASAGARPIEAPLYGLLFGLVFYPVSLPWIDSVIHQYGGVGRWTAAGILILLGLGGGAIHSVFSWGIALASKRSMALACALAPFLWVALEFGVTRVPDTGFPWNLAGYAASASLGLVQLTSVTGIFGLSFLIAGYGSLVAYAVLVRQQRIWRLTLVVTAVLILIAVIGPHLVPSAAPDHVAHLVQTNFPQLDHYPEDWLQVHAGELDQLERISVDAAKKTPGPVIWPEVPAPLSLQDPAFAARAARIGRESGGDFLVGVIDWKQSSQGEWLASNSAALLDASGRRIFTYDKVHLVPFGEYVPMRRWIKFAGRLTVDISDFTPGSVHSVGKFSSGSFGVFICYEAIFPVEIRQFAKNGADLLINISNDGWFGHSAAPAQHLMMARVRAVESRRWLLRDTNNGITASIDPYGRIVARLAPDIRGELDAPFANRSGLTFYARFGDWFAWLCVLASVASIAFAAARKMGKGK
jgi:apolipoprotein N-acyltransferase